MNRLKAGRIRKSAAFTKTCWEKTEQTDDQTIVTKVFVDATNPVSPTNKRALIQTQVFQGKYWEPNFRITSDQSKEISISEALDWCEQNQNEISGAGGNDRAIDWRIVRQRLAIVTAA
jgi:hypothetical protein